MLEFSVPQYYVESVLRGAKRQGLDIASLLEEAHILPQILDEPMSRISGQQFAQLIRVVWKSTGDEYLGLTDKASPMGSFNMMCYSIIHCQDLRSVFARASKFYALFMNLPPIKLEYNNDNVTLTLEKHSGEIDHFLMESLLLIWHRLGSWLIGKRINLLEANFSFTETKKHSEYRHLFACPLAFNQPQTGITFAAKFLDEKVVQTEETIETLLENSPANFLARPDEGNSLVARIRKMIGNDLSQELPTFEFIAQSMHTSVQTLRRHLKQEGLSYQELKDQMRRDSALYFLEHKDLSIQQIAEKLGFSEPSTFHRAFKKWTGMTPGIYRQSESAPPNP